MNQKKMPEEFLTLEKAADYAHVSRQAIYAAIYKGKLKATKKGWLWVIKRIDLDEYRANKHNRDNWKHEGEPIFNLEKGHLSAQHVAKILAEKLGRSYNTQHIYYLLRTGKLKGFRKGFAWVILVEDAQKLYEEEIAALNDQGQLKFKGY